MSEGLLSLAGPETTYGTIGLHHTGHLRSRYKRHEAGGVDSAVIPPSVRFQPPQGSIAGPQGCLSSEMNDANPAQGAGESEGPDLAARLTDMSPERLAEEVISVWEEVLKVEGELATARQRARALEMELEARESDGSARARVAELEEAVRVADSRIVQMELLLENERVRRADVEEGGGQGRFAELQEENSRLLRSEEEHMMLILDMEGQLERLVGELEGLKSRSSQ